MFIILSVLTALQAYAHIKMSQILCFKALQFIVHKAYNNKVFI